jgi:tRNA nucleotidyltransferase (CCA-adding enzyme)
MSDYNFLMESRLSPDQMRVINQLSRAASVEGLNFYLVGGAVRDLTYGQQTVRDLDFAVEGSPEKILKRLAARSIEHQAESSPPSQGAAVVAEHVLYDSRLNAADVIFSNGVRCEIAVTRSETYAKPGARPDVAPATIFEDLRRRDFSLNAMAISLHPNSRGLLLDPTNGAGDILKMELRALHSRSFFDDPSRIYRLLRLSERLGFKPDERTQRWLAAALESCVWEEVNPEQQKRELAAILWEENPGRVLKVLGEKGLLTGLDRALTPAKIPYDRFVKLRAVAKIVPNAELFLLNFHVLAEKLGGANRNRLAHELFAHKQDLKLALGLEAEARTLARTLASSKGGSPSRVYTLLSGQPAPLLLFVLAHYPQASIQTRVKSYFQKVPLVQARLPRGELAALGVPPGPKFEKILERVFLDQLDGKITTPLQVQKELRSLAGIKEPVPAPEPAARRKPGKEKKTKAADAKVAATKAPRGEAPASKPPEAKAPKAGARVTQAAPVGKTHAGQVKAAKPGKAAKQPQVSKASDKKATPQKAKTKRRM